jgi:pimeloyl-ACP methyl ester carboxylesterase
MAACSPRAQSSTQSPPTDIPRRALSFANVESPSKGHWAIYQLDEGGYAVDVYVAHDSQPKPLVILIPGSGCAPTVTVDPDGVVHDTTLFQDVVTARVTQFHFAIVEKRGVHPLRFSADMSRDAQRQAFQEAGRSCSAEYMKNVTKSQRVADVLAVVRVLGRESWVQQIMLAGHSEGTHVATGVLREMKGSEVAAAGLFASAGPIPFYGGYVARGADADRLRTIIDRIRMLQRADDDFIYEGLPARRWKTFWLETTPIEDVRESNVPLFVAQGNRDETTLLADLFALEAIRQQPNRSLRYVIVDQGNHAFETPEGKSLLPELFDDFTTWALDANRNTDVAVLK